MASPRSSEDEGEIVERRAPANSKAKTTSSATPATTTAWSNDVGGLNVDRRDRNYRGRSSRSPPYRDADRPRGNGTSSSYPYRDQSPQRRPKRQRDEWDTPVSRRDRGAHTESQRFQGRHDDRPVARDGRRDELRDSSWGNNHDRYYERSIYDDDDRDSIYGRSNASGNKRPRTRSRSPTPQPRRARGGRGWPDRERRDYDQNSDRGRDRGNDRVSREFAHGRADRDDRDGRFGGHSDGRQRQPESGLERNRQRGSRALSPRGDDFAKATKGAPTSQPSRETLSSQQRETTKTHLPQEDWVEEKPIDEEAEIRRRRQRREEILRKSRTSTPMLAVSIQGDKPAPPASTESGTLVNTPKTGGNTPLSVGVTSGSPAEEELDLTNDQDFINTLGKHNIQGGSDPVSSDNRGSNHEDGPSAADYDPTMDMEEDERRDELRHGAKATGLHGGDRRTSLPGAHASEEAAANTEGNGDEEDDDDDMFAEDFVEKKYEKAEAKAADASTKDADGHVLPGATANGGGILEGDDLQGYYKIRPGEVLDGRYQIQTALGKGMFSGVARAWDVTSDNNKLVAIKIMRNNDALRKGGYTEIAILQKLNETDPENKKHIVLFERSFDYRGHLCMVFENLSMNLREVLKKFGNNVGINLHGVRVFAYQIFVSLAHMRRCSIIHADLKPDNILVNDNRSTLKICDLGTAIDRSDAVTAHTEITPYLVSRFYRAPEIILGMPYDYAIDMWSIGCTLYELYTGKILFTGESNNQMLKAIMEIRGKISGKLYRRGDLWRMHFDDMGGFLSQEHDKFQAKTTVKTLSVIKPNRDLRTRLMAASVGMDDTETRELNHFHDLLDRCLSLNPDKRILPSDALKHPFFTSKGGR